MLFWLHRHSLPTAHVHTIQPSLPCVSHLLIFVITLRKILHLWMLNSVRERGKIVMASNLQLGCGIKPLTDEHAVSATSSHSDGPRLELALYVRRRRHCCLPKCTGKLDAYRECPKLCDAPLSRRHWCADRRNRYRRRRRR
jgi:hypothetical protein